MPIGTKKIGPAASDFTNEVRSEGCCGGKCHTGYHFGKPIFMTLLGVFIVYSTFYVGTLMKNEIKKYNYIGQADQTERTINITGTAKVTASNDIAMTTIGYSNIDQDVAKAQAENKKVMDKVYADLKQMGIQEKDLQTNYSIYPEYDYTQKGSVLKGYRVNSNLTVKIRDLNKISDVLGLAGKYGANQVTGLSFTIDDTENLKNEARTKALADAKRKAVLLANQLGVAIGEVVSYADYENSPAPIYSYAKGMGMGGGAADSGPAEVSGGTQDIVMNVTITYKIYTNR